MHETSNVVQYNVLSIWKSCLGIVISFSWWLFPYFLFESCVKFLDLNLAFSNLLQFRQIFTVNHGSWTLRDGVYIDVSIVCGLFSIFSCCLLLFPQVACKIFTELELVNTFKIPLKEFFNFFHAIERGYHDNPCKIFLK